MGEKQSKQPQPPPQSTSDKMFDNIFEFKMMAKQFAKESTKDPKASKQITIRLALSLFYTQIQQAFLLPYQDGCLYSC